jgi:hypothetical protein
MSTYRARALLRIQVSDLESIRSPDSLQPRVFQPKVPQYLAILAETFVVGADVTDTETCLGPVIFVLNLSSDIVMALTKP